MEVMMLRTFRTLIVLVIAAFALSGCNGCPSPNTEKTKEVLEKESRIKEAKIDVAKGIQAYKKYEIVNAANFFRDAIILTTGIDDFRMFPEVVEVKSNAYYWYGVVLIDIYNMADKASLVIKDENGNEIGTIASPELALKHVDFAISINPRPALFYFGKGYIYLQSGDPQTAVGFFNTAIGISKSDASLFSYRAIANYELARRIEAKEVRAAYMKLAFEDCLRARRINDYDYEAYLTLLKLYLLDGDMRSAKLVLEDMNTKKLPVTRALELYNAADR